ncbi:hypothetical protein EBME_1635 [bacterium endosymbiont of Mortierella elongata FMR23-6]|nr:hypothetical protein EBME_1635 [bacterium endosymbiont of Mortierella elongata FMR23-6]
MKSIQVSIAPAKSNLQRVMAVQQDSKDRDWQGKSTYHRI